MPNPKDRIREHEKYFRAYALNPNYKMKVERMRDAANALASLPTRGAYADISCGRGEMLKVAAKLGYNPCAGTEIVPELLGGNISYAEIHALPFDSNSFDVVTLFDVIEHLIIGDDKLACLELNRIARKHVILSANNLPSFNKAGDDLHINKRPYEEWNELFIEWFDGKVTQLTAKHFNSYKSKLWRIDL